ncbi:MAG: ATP/GTP-binding protein [Actinomycetota bacterium]
MSSRATLVRRQRSRDGAARRPMKLVVTGPFAAGKTTLIETISEVAVVGTERDVSDGAKALKSRTTVAMDFGRITFADDLALFLFGTPGQRRFEVMWEILSEGMLGFILLVRGGDQGSLDDAAELLGTFALYADVPYVVGVTHLDAAGVPRAKVLEEVRAALGVPDEVAVIGCDPRRREDVKTLMLQILFGVLERLERASSSEAG